MKSRPRTHIMAGMLLTWACASATSAAPATNCGFASIDINCPDSPANPNNPNNPANINNPNNPANPLSPLNPSNQPYSAENIANPYSTYNLQHPESPNSALNAMNPNNPASINNPNNPANPSNPNNPANQARNGRASKEFFDNPHLDLFWFAQGDTPTVYWKENGEDRTCKMNVDCPRFVYAYLNRPAPARMPDDAPAVAPAKHRRHR